MSTSAVTDSDEALDVRADDFRAALERSLALADADGRIGPVIGATRIRMRFEFTDCRGESRAALLYLPAARLISEPYRKVVESDFPDLAV